jgi:hypothetical protein
MRIHYLILAIFACSLPVPVLAAPAQPAAARTALDPMRLKAADRMLTAMNYDRMMHQTADAMIAQMGPMFRKAIEQKTGEKADDALVQQLTAIEADFMQKTIVDSADVRRAIATLYASEFTVPELNRLTDLLDDPVMRKWTEVAPDMAGKMFPLVQAVVESHREELETRIKSVVTDYYEEKTPVPHS